MLHPNSLQEVQSQAVSAWGCLNIMSLKNIQNLKLIEHIFRIIKLTCVWVGQILKTRTSIQKPTFLEVSSFLKMLLHLQCQKHLIVHFWWVSTK